jgi:hypothetical protein
MKIDEVPQEESMLEGHQRACYAVDAAGRYVVVGSIGWEVEKVVNSQAVDEVRRVIDAARDRVLRGEASVLAYHMARCQMTIGLLAANTGIWSLRVRRHLKPAVFAGLDPSLLARYADALGITVAELQRMPDTDSASRS